MSEPRPTVGICTALARANWGAWKQREAALLAFSYIEAIQRAGGMAVMIPPDGRFENDPDEILDLLDGLILAGGNDIDPAHYGAERHPETHHLVPERDRAELALAIRAVERDIPVLGICRGMQLINVAFGGTLRQHLPDELGHHQHRRTVGSFDDADHDVRLTPGSLAARAAGEELHTSKSHHHQGIAAVGEGLEVTGRSTLDDLPEAIEAPDRRFVLGVQWHPEADEQSRIVGAVVEEARGFRRERDYRNGRGSSYPAVRTASVTRSAWD
ncbi:MAG TPA: gamma-glutamyl-gamma-aminobutyrate hydrolase family protein [Solirubrobacteraceae bacterium]|nr:gamma-glutamyl-gamma-aminobutyrate hydrolase family protein [Solirubrobacteraceae bacterium]